MIMLVFKGERCPQGRHDFKRGYQLIVMEVQRQISLRNRDLPAVKNKEKTSKASTRKTKSIPPPKESSTNVAEPKGNDRKEDNQRISD